VKGLIVIGVSARIRHSRFIDAYDAVPARANGASTLCQVRRPGRPWKAIRGRWAALQLETGTYDATTNQISGLQETRALESRRRLRRDNLYSNSLLALTPTPVSLNWYFQFTKHDEHDWDATQVPVMIDTGGKHMIAASQPQRILLRD